MADRPADPDAANRAGHLHAATAHRGGGRPRRRLSIALALALSVVVLEGWGSVVTGSLALLADATHVLADVGALVLALAAVFVAGRPHTVRWTFGYHRAEVLAASLNALVLLLVAAFVTWRAVERLRSPEEIQGGGLLVIALIGLLANGLAWFVLKGSTSINVRAARLHVLSDLGGSVAAVTAGVLTLTTGWERADPLLSMIIVALVVFGALRLLYETLSILMARVPAGIDIGEVERELRALPGIVSVHDTHCWTITTGFVAFASHLQLAPGADAQTAVEQAAELLRGRFGIEHVTLQPDATPVLDPFAIGRVGPIAATDEPEAHSPLTEE